MRGRAIKLSASRRLVGDLMHFSLGVPRVTVQRRIDVSSLVRARTANGKKRSWTAIFLKAYALLARETPELRRTYVKLPWPHLYEYPVSVASVAHERDLDGEKAVLLTRIKCPERDAIRELEEFLHRARTLPVHEVRDFRRALKFSRAPTIVRRLLMWLGLNIARQKANYFGTFQLSVYSGLGAESLNPLTPLTTLLNYGPIEDGFVTVRIHYDHRVMDGATVARALGKFDEILNGVIAEELADSG
jgi:hypothetical protein